MKDLNYLTENIGKIAKDLRFPDEAIDSLLYDLAVLCADEESFCVFSGIIESYEKTCDIDYAAALENMKTISAKIGVHEYACNMLHFLSLCPKLRERYAERGLSDSLFVDTMQDLKFKVVESHIVHGVWGTFVPKWYARFFRDFDRFFFTRLQFEPATLRLDCEIDGVEYKAGAKCLNVHIPRTETKLDHLEVLDSYRRAAEFYADFFGEDPVLIACDTWLNFPKHDEILKPGSNLLLFAHDYKILQVGYYEDGGSFWRTFDKPYNNNPDDMPTDTTLRRAYVDMLKRGEKLGHAYGVIVYEQLAKKFNMCAG